LVAPGCDKVVVIADQTLVAPSVEVALET